jgi:hypothetical protein
MLDQLKALGADGRAGECIIYHRGFLWLDTAGNSEVADIGLTALKLAEAGKLLLFQRKHGFRDYSYIAVRATPPILKLIKHCASAARKPEAVS